MSDVCLSDVCLSVAYIGPNSRIERPRKTEALSDAFVWCMTSVYLTSVCLSVAYIGPNSRIERPRKTKNWHKGSPRHTWLGHHFQGQMVKDQLVADVLNSQHAGTGATWRINAKILSTCRGGGIATRTACYYSAPKLILIYRPTEGRRLSWPRHCRNGAHSQHNCPQRDSIPGPCALQWGMLPLDHCDLQGVES